MSRQVYLHNYDFDAFGTTRGCPNCDWFRRTQSWQGQGRPHSNACRARIMGELAKSAAGRTRLGAAVERLDRTVGDLGQQFRSDVPQGENAVMEPDRSEQMPPSFLPIPEQDHQGLSGDAGDNRKEVYESREVLPSPDEPGVGETREMRSEDEPYVVPLCPDDGG